MITAVSLVGGPRDGDVTFFQVKPEWREIEFRDHTPASRVIHIYRGTRESAEDGFTARYRGTELVNG